MADSQIAELPKVIGDVRRFQQVLINIVKNAIKFTNEGSIEVKVCYRTDLESLVVHVCDSGVGIAAEDISKLFSRFGKLSRTAQQNSEGIGLGLTIVKQIVEQSGGAVSIESDGIGKGTLFIVCMKMDHIKEPSLNFYND